MQSGFGKQAGAVFRTLNAASRSRTGGEKGPIAALNRGRGARCGLTMGPGHLKVVIAGPCEMGVESWDSSV